MPARPDSLRALGWVLALSTVLSGLWHLLWVPVSIWLGASLPWVSIGVSGLLAVGLAWASRAPSSRTALGRSAIAGLGTVAGAVGSYVGIVPVGELLTDIFPVDWYYGYGTWTPVNFMLCAAAGSSVLGPALRTGRLALVAGERTGFQLGATLPFVVLAGAAIWAESILGTLYAVVSGVWLHLVLRRPPVPWQPPRFDAALRRRIALAGSGALLVLASIVGTGLAIASAPHVVAVELGLPQRSLPRLGVAGAVAVALLWVSRAGTPRRSLVRGSVAVAVFALGTWLAAVGWQDVSYGDRPWLDALDRWRYNVPSDYIIVEPELGRAHLWIAPSATTAAYWAAVSAAVLALPVLGRIGRAVRADATGRSVGDRSRAILAAPFALIAVTALIDGAWPAAAFAVVAAAWLDWAFRAGPPSTTDAAGAAV